jgi:NAD(P)-dependent dehydrogenase (short-subunit alcohol dehydrogenase family)
MLTSAVDAIPRGYPGAVLANVNEWIWSAPMQIEGTNALVIGGASGLGEATARRLHADGASVVIGDLNAEKGEALVAELGERARFVEANVLEAEQVQAAVDAAGEGGELRISVCCAGIGWAQRTVSKQGPHDLEIFSNVIKVNLIGTFNSLRLAAAAMVDNDPDADGGRGVCVNTASIAAFDGQIGQVAYAASKGGIVGLTLPAARDLAGRGVRVVTIAPGLFDTPLLAALPEDSRAALGAGIPFPSRLGKPAEYADMVAAIVANPMLNGETIRLDGALRMPPK